MGIETERKFLVDTEMWKPQGRGTKMVQGYLGLSPGPTVRIRIAGRKAFLTIKGRSKTMSRPEFEYEIPVKEARQLLKLAISFPVEKTRYEIMHEGFWWEVDVFSGKNKGLVMAEIELESEDQAFDKPDWALNEVTYDGRYYNSFLSVCPFQLWES